MKDKIMRNKKYIIIFLLITVLSLAIRQVNIDFRSGDYRKYLSTWIEDINQSGGMVNYTGNYNLPYVLILLGLNYLPGNMLYKIKAISILFDYILAICGAILVYKIKREKRYFLFTYATILLVPTVILNSSMWAQCDSIYISFIIASLIFLMDKKYIQAMILLGIAVSFKLQTFFIFPLYILVWSRERKLKWYYFAIIPFVNIILFLPGVIGGYAVTYASNLAQNIGTTSTKYLSANFPGVYNWFYEGSRGNAIFQGDSIVILGMILIWFIVTTAVILYCNRKKAALTPIFIIEMGLFLALLCTFLLPGMHDRYNYLADILSIIYAFIVGKKKVYVPILIIGASLVSYIQYLYGITLVKITYTTTAIFVLLMIFTITLIKKGNTLQKQEEG